MNLRPIDLLGSTADCEGPRLDYVAFRPATAEKKDADFFALLVDEPKRGVRITASASGSSALVAISNAIVELEKKLNA